MKKLMMAVAIVCAAVAAQAASIEWMQITSEIMAGDSTTVVADSSPVYLILSSYAQTDFAAAYAAANGDMDATITAAGANVLGSSTIDSGFIYDVADYTSPDVSAYYVVFAADKAYISDIAVAIVDPLDPSASIIEWGAPTNSELPAVAAGSYAGGAGWVEAVPEPTSGLLLLLGMAGLALRRRRA